MSNRHERRQQATHLDPCTELLDAGLSPIRWYAPGCTVSKIGPAIS